MNILMLFWNPNNTNISSFTINLFFTWQYIVTVIGQGALVGLITLVLYKIFNHCRFVKQFKHLPQEETNFILGDLHQLVLRSSWKNFLPFTVKSSIENKSTPLRDTTEYFISRRNRAKSGIGVLWLGWFPVVWCLDYKSAQAILSSRRHINKGRFYKLIAPFMKDGLITSNGEKWRQRRRLIGPAFSTTIMSQFIPLMVKNASMLVQSFRAKASTSLSPSNDGVINIVDYIHLTSMDIICQTAMGISPEAQTKPRSLVVQAVTWMTKELAYRIYNPFLWVDLIFIASPMGRNFKTHLKNFENFTHSIIDSKLSHHQLGDKSMTEKLINLNGDDNDNGLGEKDENNNVNTSNCPNEDGHYQNCGVTWDKERRAFLDLLLEKHLQPPAVDGKPIIDFKGVQEEINTFLFAGYETTGTAIMWILYLLGLHSNIQEKIYAEISSVFDDELNNLTYGQLQHLTYLEQCIKEGLRLFPPVPMIARELDEEIILDGYKIPGGTSVAIMIYTIHRDSTIYPNPDSFNPDRFDRDHISSIPAYAFIPFSAGPRVCIGQRFAYIEMKIILSHIIKNFYLISTKPLDQVPYEFEVTIRPKVPLDIKFISRQQKT